MFNFLESKKGLISLPMPAQIFRYKTIIFTLLIGLAIAFGAFRTIQFYEYQQEKNQFQASFSDKVTGLSQAITAIEKVLIATQHLVTTQRELNRKQFAQLVNDDLLSNTGLEGILWLPRISQQQAREFQFHVQQSGIFDYRIKSNIYGHHCKSSSDLFPVLFAEPMDKLGHELGTNMASDCDMANSLINTLAKNEITAADFTNEINDVGLRIFLPIIRDGDNTGFIVGVLMINQLVDSLWGELTGSDNYTLSILSSGKNPHQLYNSTWRQNCQNSNCQNEQFAFESTTQIPFTDQVWEIEFKQKHFTGHKSYYPLLAACLLLCATLMLSYYLYNNINRIQWANKLVEERTASLQFQVSHDQLTHLLNKKSLFHTLDRLTDRTKGQFQPFSILFIDLDHFKKINDTMGHMAGDELLKIVSQRLRENSRDDDLIFRFGGDEFVIILRHLSSKQRVVSIAELYLETVQSPYVIQQQSHRINASIGASIVDKPQLDKNEILRNTDIAMYRAKEKGRGQVIFFQQNMYHQVLSQHNLENELNDALKKQQFILYFQPICSGNHQVLGFEALVRWRKADGSIVPPFEFIPLVEKTGKIKQLGEMIASQAISQLAEMYNAYGRERCPYISINISSLQLLDSDIVELIRNQLRYYRLPANLLAIELTESTLIDNHDLIRQHLTALNKIGVRIFLDDFGTGYSSLSLLQHFPIDVIKIDRSFVMALTTETLEAKNLVKAIVSMAQALNMKVIAEGIEAVAVIKWLQSIGCQSFQGYYFSKPIPKEQIRGYLLETRLFHPPHLTNGESLRPSLVQ